MNKSEGINNIFPPHFRDFIIALNQNDVEYLIIGGYAVGAYGHIRSTADLDIFIHATNENAAKAISACISYGIQENQLLLEMFLVPKMIGIGEPPLRIEILKTVGIVDFKYAYERSNKINLDGLKINVISLDDLIVLKTTALKDGNQTRDKEDYEYLQKLKNRLNE